MNHQLTTPHKQALYIPIKKPNAAIDLLSELLNKGFFDQFFIRMSF
ncbi:hypothetical protein ACWOE5_07355 [Aerococcus sanguinicola]|nr:MULTISPECIES: hypothetical protein [Aerococcus]MDK7050510.1 hypothetical protein [Aerococcus sanguinicola]